MFNKITTLVIFLFLSPFIWAQNTQTIDRSLELRIGQAIPAIPKLSVLNSVKNQVLLGQLSNKIIILDFFDTYCTNCIAAMPKLQKLQKKYADKIQVIMVTWQDKATIEKFYKTNAFIKDNKINLVTVYADTLLRKYFPHKGVPHTAWIYKNKVQAITFSDFVKAENIEYLYANGSIQLPVKSDFNDGLKNDAVNEKKKQLGSVSLSGYKDAVDPNGIIMKYDSISGMQKSSFYNIDILGAYTGALSKIKKPEFLLKDERIVWKVRDSSFFKYPNGDVVFNEWLLRNGICYERYDHVVRPDSVQAQFILNDLNGFLGLHVYWSKKEMPCLVLEKTNLKSSEVKTSDGELAGTSVLAFMIDYQNKYPPVVDEVNSKQKIRLTDYSNLEQINLQLLGYGLQLKEKYRLIDVLVFDQLN
ncbi:TlpA family protein disulfide reductase [Sphingobacterium kitahiroshimense]|uniref:TlpA disulfide reductase family protein n=1 Tax=Sphingobacterium kitahiroshimense TaxID=470446 RepID=A0ABV0BW41_9SPHI